MTNTPKYSLKKGTIINNRYEILRYISSGGFGITYEAIDKAFNARVAIKELYIKEICNREDDSLTVSVNETNEPTFVTHRRKFIEEARRLHKLSHPNIVKVSDVFETNGTAYFVMDYIDGKPLSRIGVPISEAMARHYINPILDALEHVHSNGVLHLDIKPGNIMIDNSGKAILIDFGASKVFGDSDGNSLSLSSSLAYTPGYAPLEQMSVKTVKDLGPYSDIYALGATLYYILSGEKPLLPGEILENDGKLPLIENISNEMQCAISQATKVVRTTRLNTIDQFRRALKGEIIDVKAEDRRKKAEEERRRQEEEERRKATATVITVIPKKIDETKLANNGSSNTKTVDTDKPTDNETSEDKHQKLSKILIAAVLVALITIISLAGYRYLQNQSNEDSFSTPINNNHEKKETTIKQPSDNENTNNNEEIILTDSATTESVAPSDSNTNTSPIVVHDSSTHSDSPQQEAKEVIKKEVKPKSVAPKKTVQSQVSKPKPTPKQSAIEKKAPTTKPAPQQNINKTVNEKKFPKKPSNRGGLSGGSAFRSSETKKVNSDPFKKEQKVNADPFNKEQKVKADPFN